MPIAASDIKRRLSVKTGSAGNSTAQGDPNASLGKYISTTDITDATLHNLFDIVSATENEALDVEYRCIFVYNSHSTLTWGSAVCWISAETASGASIAIGVDTTAASAVGSASAQALEVANESTAPVGVTFSSPTTQGTGISIGSLTAGQCRAIWIRRTCANTGAVDTDGVTLSFSGTT